MSTITAQPRGTQSAAANLPSATVTAKTVTPVNAPAAQPAVAPVATPTVTPPATPEVAKPTATEEQQKFLQLARKEKAARERERQLDAREALIAQRDKEIEDAKSWRIRFTKEPLAVMNEAGITYDQLTQHILASGNQTDPNIVKLQAELTQIKKLQEEQLEATKNEQKNAYDRAVKQITVDVDKLVRDNPEFELTSQMNTQAAVVKLIETTFNEEGYLMSTEDAAKEVENWLEEQLLLGVKSKKIQGKITPVSQEVSQPATVTPKPVTTITNQVVQASTKPLTANERRARAIAAFNGQKTN